MNPLIYLLFFLIIGNGVFAQVSDDKLTSSLEKAEEMLKSDPSKSIYYSNLAMIEAQKTGDQSSLAKAMSVLGEAYMNQGDFDMGFEAISEAVEACPPDNIDLTAYIYLRLSSCYIRLKDYDKAFTYVDQAAAIYQQLGDKQGLAVCYNSRGLVYIQVPDNRKAEMNLKEALKLNRELGAHKRVAANLNNLCLYEGDTPEKIAMLQEAIFINDSLGAVWSLAENYNNLGVQYFYGKEYAKALDALSTAREYATSIKAKELLNDNYRYYSWVYEAQKNYEAAYENLLNLFKAENESSVSAQLRQIEVNMIQKSALAKEQDMILTKQALQIKNLRMRQYIYLLLIGATIMIFIYLGFHYRQRKKIQMLETTRKLDEQKQELIELRLHQAENDTRVIEKELNHNRQELTNFAFFIRSRNDMLAQIQSMIKEGYKLSGGEMATHLRRIHSYISQFNAKNTETEVLIDQISADFMDKLSLLHPDLSKNEQRLASLLKIGLSTKEIASVIGSTPKTVNMARYRLRKRMNLETDESLSEYIKSI